jgi:hypothetical protein
MRTLDEIADELERDWWHQNQDASKALAAEIRAHARGPRHFASSNPSGMTTEDDQARAYPAGMRAFLYDNDDAGVQQVSVALVESPDYWIWSYPTEDQARAACKQHGWVIDKVRSVKP